MQNQNINEQLFEEFRKQLSIESGEKNNNLLEVIKNLVEKKADVNAVDEHKWNALHFACNDKNISFEIIKYFIENKSNINQINNYGGNLVRFCCENKNISIDIIKYLVEQKVDVNCVDYYKWSPLHYASNNQNHLVSIINFLAFKMRHIIYDDMFKNKEWSCLVPKIFFEDKKVSLIESDKNYKITPEEFFQFKVRCVKNDVLAVKIQDVYEDLCQETKKLIFTSLLFFKKWSKDNKVIFPRPLINMILSFSCVDNDCFFLNKSFVQISKSITPEKAIEILKSIFPEQSEISVIY